MLKRKYLIAISIAIAVALMLVSSAQAPIGLPDYDSGWKSVGQGSVLTLTHNLNTTEILVRLTGRIMEGAPENIRYYGTTDGDKGAYWRIWDSNTLHVYRGSTDGEWAQVRVMIWKIEPELGVGGLYIPVDKFSLLTPYIALVLTVIIAIAVSVTFLKYRKKQ